MIIGLTGGIASGKSTVSAYLAQKGIPVFDADRSGWHVEEKGSPCLARLAKRFGEKILMADGRLDRTRLAALAFRQKRPHRILMQSSMAQSKKKGMRFYAFIRTTASWSLTPPPS